MTAISLHQPIPPDLSVRAARQAYLAENGFDMEQYDADWVPVNLWGVRFSFPNPKNRKLAVRYHDLHHIMTGYGTDEVGEAQISVWELRHGIGVFGLFVQLIILTQIILGLVHSPRIVLRAWKKVPKGKRLPQPSFTHYESYLDMSLGGLRQSYGLPRAGLEGARALHGDAPK